MQVHLEIAVKMVFLCMVQCILLAAVTTDVSSMVEGRHSSPRSSRLRSHLLRHLSGAFPLPVLPAVEVSHAFMHFQSLSLW